MHPIHFRNAWRIRKSDMPSKIYRYLEQKHIDSFFDTGLLKLSSFQSNRTIEDQVRQDQEEGYHTYRMLSRDRSSRHELKVKDMDFRRMLCCSTTLNLDVLTSHFNVDGCFEITNSTGFGYEIAKVLNSFEFGQEGTVDYTDENYTYFLLEQHLQLPDITKESKIQDLFPHIDAIGRLDLNMFFHKKNLFAPEKEYRLVWKCKPEHELFIKCPGAIKYCKKIT